MIKNILTGLLVVSALLVGGTLGVVQKERVLGIFKGHLKTSHISEKGRSSTSEPTPSPLTATAVNDGSAIQLVRVIRVIDGDTVELEGGDRVRYVGVDTPERGESLFKEATDRNRQWVEGQVVALKICTREPKDSYGRWLGWIYKGPTLVNVELVREGLGYVMIIPPCGLDKLAELTEAHLEAQRQHLGLWSHYEQFE